MLAHPWPLCQLDALFQRCLPRADPCHRTKTQCFRILLILWEGSNSSQPVAVGLAITCKGVESSATDVTSRHSRAGCSVGDVRREGAHDPLQQERLPSPFEGEAASQWPGLSPGSQWESPGPLTCRAGEEDALPAPHGAQHRLLLRREPRRGPPLCAGHLRDGRECAVRAGPLPRAVPPPRDSPPPGAPLAHRRRGGGRGRTAGPAPAPGWWRRRTAAAGPAGAGGAARPATRRPPWAAGGGGSGAARPGGSRTAAPGRRPEPPAPPPAPRRRTAWRVLRHHRPARSSAPPPQRRCRRPPAARAGAARCGPASRWRPASRGGAGRAPLAAAAPRPPCSAAPPPPSPRRPFKRAACAAANQRRGL